MRCGRGAVPKPTHIQREGAQLRIRGTWSAGPGDDQARFLADLRALRDSAAIGYDELAARAGPQCSVAFDLRLANLTEREQEISVLIGSGESNKQIARRLDITERTVKAHLTEIFRKLGITDRLRLALLVTNGSNLRRSRSLSPALLQR